MSTAASLIEPINSPARQISIVRNEMGGSLNFNYDQVRAAATIRIRRSATRSITRELLTEFNELVSDLGGQLRTDANFLIVRSDLPKTFCLGGDLQFFKNCLHENSRQTLTKYAFDAVKAIYSLSGGAFDQGTTSVALVQGEAQGGGFELALANHVIVAERGVKFGFPEGLFGAFPGMGAKRLLELRCQRHIAAEIVASSRQWSSEELFELGIVDILAEKGEGDRALQSFMYSATENALTECRSRFKGISLIELRRDVVSWINRMLELKPRDLRALDFILRAQHRAPSADALSDFDAVASAR